MLGDDRVTKKRRCTVGLTGVSGMQMRRVVFESNSGGSSRRRRSYKCVWTRNRCCLSVCLLVGRAEAGDQGEKEVINWTISSCGAIVQAAGGGWERGRYKGPTAETFRTRPILDSTPPSAFVAVPSYHSLPWIGSREPHVLHYSTVIVSTGCIMEIFEESSVSTLSCKKNSAIPLCMY